MAKKINNGEMILFALAGAFVFGLIIVGGGISGSSSSQISKAETPRVVVRRPTSSNTKSRRAPVNIGNKRIADRINERKPNDGESKVAIPRYTIVETEDISYHHCKRYNIRVHVDHALSSNELKTISNIIIANFKATRPFNALSMLFYLPDSDINGGYTAGMTEYAPYGDWSRADDVQTGEYTNHRLRGKVGNATGFDPEKSRVPGLSIETKKRIFFKLVAAQDRGVGDNEAYGIIANKFSVDETTVRKIVIEGIANGWPMP